MLYLAARSSGCKLNPLEICCFAQVFLLLEILSLCITKILPCENNKLKLLFLRQGLNVKEQESTASLIWAQAKSIFTWREEGSNEESKRLNLFPTKKIVPDIEPILPRKNNQIGDIVVFLRNELGRVQG